MVLSQEPRGDRPDKWNPKDTREEKGFYSGLVSCWYSHALSSNDTNCRRVAKAFECESLAECDQLPGGKVKAGWEKMEDRLHNMNAWGDKRRG